MPRAWHRPPGALLCATETSCCGNGGTGRNFVIWVLVEELWDLHFSEPQAQRALCLHFGVLDWRGNLGKVGVGIGGAKVRVSQIESFLVG